MAAGSTNTRTFNWGAWPGTHAIRAVADNSNTVTESNEGNNSRTVDYSGTLAPDLIVLSISSSPATPAAGQTVTFTVTVKNQGNATAQGFFTGYYIDNVFQGQSDMVLSLAAGSTVTQVFQWTALQGSHAFKAFTDYNNNLVLENNETNNQSQVNLTIP